MSCAVWQRGVFYRDVDELLQSMSDLRFDLLPPADANNGVSSLFVALRCVALRCVALRDDEHAPTVARTQAAPRALSASMEFAGFLPRAVQKDAAGTALFSSPTCPQFVSPST